MECGITVHVAMIFLSSSLMDYNNNIKFHNLVRQKTSRQMPQKSLRTFTIKIYRKLIEIQRFPVITS